MLTWPYSIPSTTTTQVGSGFDSTLRQAAVTCSQLVISDSVHALTPRPAAKQPTVAYWRGGGGTASMPTCTMTAETPSVTLRRVALRCVALRCTFSSMLVVGGRAGAAGLWRSSNPI